VRLTAPAKLTLSLRVTGVRPDGYHLLDAEMVSLDLADVLEFAPGDAVEVVDETVGGAGIGDLDGGPANLVRRALSAVGRRARVRLIKRIPVGAGLGGGSADAAAVLRWAGCRDTSLGASLGADVPFCMSGGRARVRGAGEQVEPLEYEQRRYLLLLPPLAVDTAAAYRAFDQGARPSPTDDAGNDLEAAALAVCPELAAWRRALARVSGRRPRLAGSGAAWFVEDDGASWAERIGPCVVVDGQSAPLVVAWSVPGFATETAARTGGGREPGRGGG
jgi:4-diphosphocytidyl-2-C-methyl-D-erythritol kinase